MRAPNEVNQLLNMQQNDYCHSSRKKEIREPKFILDVHLGKLARYLRMLGFDTLYENDYTDPEIVNIAKIEKRAVLTRDTELLKIKAIEKGYLIKSKNHLEQLAEVILRFDLASKIRPFSRCMVCNGVVVKVEKEAVIGKLLPKTRQYYEEFFQCNSCERVYWKGSHYIKMNRFIGDFLSEISGS